MLSFLMQKCKRIKNIWTSRRISPATCRGHPGGLRVQTVLNDVYQAVRAGVGPGWPRWPGEPSRWPWRPWEVPTPHPQPTAATRAAPATTDTSYLCVYSTASRGGPERGRVGPGGHLGGREGPWEGPGPLPQPAAAIRAGPAICPKFHYFTF